MPGTRPSAERRVDADVGGGRRRADRRDVEDDGGAGRRDRTGAGDDEVAHAALAERRAGRRGCRAGAPARPGAKTDAEAPGV